jgi:hypothetical protein
MAKKRTTSTKQTLKDQPLETARQADPVTIERNGDPPVLLNEVLADEKAVETENRKAPRTITDLKTIVQFQTAPDKTWKEVTRVLTVSKSGASFSLTHHCDVGRLVTLVMPLPTEFRVYDFTEELYPVIGLIQYCYLSAADGDQPSYSVGVAFVGKCFPDGHKENPMQNYHISGTTSSGMWQIKPSGATFKVRAAPRFWIPLDVTITQIKRERSNYKEHALVSNVSTSGAMVTCTLDVEIGERIKFASKEHDFYTIGIVRNRQLKEGKKPALHIEFVDNRFPVEKLAVPKVTAVTD